MAFAKIAQIQKDKYNLYLTTFSDIVQNNRIESRYRFWFNDPEVCKYNSHGLFPYNPLMDDLKTFLSDRSRIVWSIIVNEYNTSTYFHIGNVSLQSINMINRSAEIACVIGEPKYWNKGIMTWACEEIIKHGFKKLGLNRIWTGTSSLNMGMQKVFYKLGFEQEGCFKEGQFLNGRFCNIIVFGLLKKAWEKMGSINCGDSITGYETLSNAIDKIVNDETTSEWDHEKELAKILSDPIQSANKIADRALINKLEKIRAKNNTHWMDLVRLAFDSNMDKARQIMKKIDECDGEIKQITTRLANE